MNDNLIPPTFPEGLRVFLRTTNPSDGTLHNIIFPSGREVLPDPEIPELLLVHDANDKLLASFHYDAIACIVALITEGPAAHEKN
jgi:hypothetical protein